MPKELDEKGFVFVGGDGNAYRCCMWGESPWLFKWHPDNHWVSFHRLTQMDVFLLPHNLAPEQQEHYFVLEAKTLQELMPDTNRADEQEEGL